MRMHALAALTGAALSLASGAQAAKFTPPVGCETFLTVQSKGCTVSLLWRCEAAKEGEFWEASFGPGGLESLFGYAANYQWLDATYLWNSSREVYLPPAADPIDVTVLTGEGIDTYDFAMSHTEAGESHDIRVIGADRLSGRTTELDGQLLDLIDTEIRILGTGGEVEYQSHGTQYYSRDLGVFFLGPETVIESDGSETAYDGSPVDIILPGEPGFGVPTPLYECSQQDASFAPLLPRHKETNDDLL